MSEREHAEDHQLPMFKRSSPCTTAVAIVVVVAAAVAVVIVVVAVIIEVAGKPMLEVVAIRSAAVRIVALVSSPLGQKGKRKRKYRERAR